MPAEAASDDVEGGVGEDSAGREEQQTGTQAGLVLPMEAELLDPGPKQTITQWMECIMYRGGGGG